MKCDSYKTFFNRCKLLYHVYSHKTYLTEPIYRELSIDMIQLEKAFALNERSSSASSNFDINDVTNVMPITDQNRIKINEFLSKLEENNYEAIKCYVCDALFFDVEQLKAHYLNSKQLNKDSNTKTTTITSNVLNEFEFDDESTELNETTMDLDSSSDTLSSNDTIQQSAAVTAYIKDVECCYKKSCDPKLFEKYSLSEEDIELINKFSYKRLQFSTKCSMLANLNLLYNNFFLYPETKAEAGHLRHIEIPLICSECGICINLNSSNKTSHIKTQIENFRNHLVTQCYYSISYFKQKCMKPECNFVFSSKKEYVEHWSDKHIRKVKYCVLCGPDDEKRYLKSDTEAHIHKHLSDNHKEVLNVANNTKLFVKDLFICECQKELCSFDIWKLCRKHYMQKLGISMTYINCFLCKKNIHYPRLRSHLLTSHKIKSPVICNQCGLVDE